MLIKMMVIVMLAVTIVMRVDGDEDDDDDNNIIVDTSQNESMTSCGHHGHDDHDNDDDDDADSADGLKRHSVPQLTWMPPSTPKPRRRSLTSLQQVGVNLETPSETIH